VKNSIDERKIAVVIPIYNGEKFLMETLESVYAQEYSSFTVLLCDDGSTDNSLEVIRKTKNFSSAKVILISHSENLGPSVSVADLILKAKEIAEIAVILGHDDLLPPDYLRKINHEFNDSKTVLVTVSAIQIDEESNRLKAKNSPPFLRVFGRYLPAFLLAANQITAPGVAFRINAFDPKFLGTDNPHTQDWSQWIYTSLRGGFKLCTKTNVFYRRHPFSMTSKNDFLSAHIEISRSRLEIIESNEFMDYQNSLSVLQKHLFHMFVKFLFLEFSNCSHNTEFKIKISTKLFPAKNHVNSNKVTIECCDAFDIIHPIVHLKASEKSTPVGKALEPDSIFANVCIGIFFTVRIIAAGFWHVFVSMKRKLKNHFFEITIYSTGGLGAQLGGLSYALWMQRKFERPVKIQYHEKGLTYYPIVVKELLFGVRYEIIAASLDNNVNQSDPFKRFSKAPKVRFLQRAKGYFKKLFIRFLTSSGIIVSSEHLSISSLEHVMPQTKIVRGYHSDLRVIEETWELLTKQFAKSSIRNFMVGSGRDETIALHWRLGDYLTNPHANFTHGTVSTDSIVACLRRASSEFKISNVRVFSDSPELAKFNLMKCHNEFDFTIESGEIWDDLFEMSRSKVFIGSHSSISTWAAISIARANPSAGVYLPDKWFKNLPPGFETSDEKFIMPQEIFLNMRSYDVTLI
jgi:glycosyltransferase involved in cell wall biosynthesis